jgi:heme/copper-type cytochrome/quinol oxidase subunit 3
MSTATAPSHEAHTTTGGSAYERILPITPGKFAMWLFLATEIMFFTGLIGSYIVLRFGSKHWPEPAVTVVLLKNGDKVRGMLDSESRDKVTVTPIGEKEKKTFAAADVIPQDERGTEVLAKRESPLNLPLTAANTFFLICSSVTMVLALAAVQKGDQAKFKQFLLATICIGALFVSIQFYEYNNLINHDHFTPRTNLFASCFYVMTGCHGAHVTGGVIYLIGIFIGAVRGKFNEQNNSAVELAGLYWHFVDLVWILLFTVVYLI